MRAVRLVFGFLMIAAVAGCSPEKAMDFGVSDKEVTAPPEDALSRQIMQDFDGKSFVLGSNDRQAEVRMKDWAPARRILIPFWLGVNPLYPNFLRPTVGHIYVMSESVLVRPLGADNYLMRAGSKLFKTDAVFESTHTRYVDTGKMLPTIVRFVGTRVITVPKDAPATGTVTERVPVLKEVSLPMQLDEPLAGYAKFEVSPKSPSRRPASERGDQVAATSVMASEYDSAHRATLILSAAQRAAPPRRLLRLGSRMSVSVLAARSTGSPML